MSSYQPTWGKDQAKTECVLMSQRQINLRAMISIVCVFGRDQHSVTQRLNFSSTSSFSTAEVCLIFEATPV